MMNHGYADMAQREWPQAYVIFGWTCQEMQQHSHSILPIHGYDAAEAMLLSHHPQDMQTR